jgi:hypothetical protein
MKEELRSLGLDVHAETIAVAVAEPEGEVRSLGTIPNRAESIRKLIKKPRLAESETLETWIMDRKQKRIKVCRKSTWEIRIAITRRSVAITSGD